MLPHGMFNKNLVLRLIATIEERDKDALDAKEGGYV